MKKIFISVAMICTMLLFVTGCGKTESKIKTVDDMKKMIASIYEESGLELPALDTNELDLTNDYLLKSFTGLTSSEEIESAVISTPFVNIVPYSLAVVKLKDSADVDTVKQEIFDNINMRKWICVSAEELYVNNNGNVVFVIMANKDIISPIYEGFKKYVNNEVGKELYKENEELSFEDEELEELN